MASGLRAAAKKWFGSLSEEDRCWAGLLVLVVALCLAWWFLRSPMCGLAMAVASFAGPPLIILGRPEC